MWFAVLVLGAALALLLFLNLFYWDHWLESDMAAEMIFSKLLFEGNEFLATTKWYYSTEFRVLYTQIFMEPLFALTNSWHLIRSITNFLTYGLLLWSYFFVCKPLGIQKSTAILTSAILLLPLSETFMTHVQLGNTYMPHMIIVFFAFGMFLRLCGKPRQKNARNITLLLGYMLLCLICGISGIRYLLAIQVPLGIASIIYLMKSDVWNSLRNDYSMSKIRFLFSQERLAYIKYSVIGAFLALIGYGLNIVFISPNFRFQTYDVTNFIGVYQGIFFERVQDTFGSLLMLFGYIADRAFLSLRGVVTICAFCFLGVIFFVTLRTKRLLRIRQQSDDLESKTLFAHRKFLVIFFMVAFAVNTFVFVFTHSTIVPRYYLTVFQFALPILAVYYHEEKQTPDKFLITILLCFCLVLTSAKVSYSLITTDKNEDKRAVAAFLQEEDYAFGYATYDHANIMQELTNGNVQIANLWDIGGMNFFHWSSPVAYYRDDYYEGSVFLLVSQEEGEDYGDIPVLQAGTLIYEDAYYRVYLYENQHAILQYQSP